MIRPDTPFLHRVHDSDREIRWQSGEKTENDFILFVEKSQYFDVSGIKGIDAQIELDMSKEEVEKVLVTSCKMNLIEYLTA